MMQYNVTYKVIGHCLTSLRIQTQKLFYFEGIKEDGTWLYEKLPTFKT